MYYNTILTNLCVGNSTIFLVEGYNRSEFFFDVAASKSPKSTVMAPKYNESY